MIALAEWIPENVVELAFDFDWNQRITDTGLRSLAAHLPQTSKRGISRWDISSSRAMDGARAREESCPCTAIQGNSRYHSGKEPALGGFRWLMGCTIVAQIFENGHRVPSQNLNMDLVCTVVWPWEPCLRT